MAHQYIPGTNSFGAIDNADNILKSESPFVSLSIDLNRLSFKTEYSPISAPFKNKLSFFILSFSKNIP